MTGKIGRLGLISAVALTLVLPQAVSAGTPAPANDNFADATQIAFLPFEDSFVDNTNATVETGTGETGCSYSEHTVWYRIQPSRDYTVKFKAIAESGIDLLMATWEGTALDALSLTWCIDGSGNFGTETITQSLFAGHTYYLQVGGYVGSTGAFTVRARKLPGPVNDFFALASNAAMGSTSSVDTTKATFQVDEPFASCGSYVDHTVWYRHVATTTRTVVANTLGSNFDTVLAVYSGTDLTSLSPVACNDDRGVDALSKVKFTMQAGLTYYFQIGGYEHSYGSLSFTFRKA